MLQLLPDCVLLLTLMIKSVVVAAFLLL